VWQEQYGERSSSKTGIPSSSRRHCDRRGRWRLCGGRAALWLVWALWALSSGASGVALIAVWRHIGVFLANIVLLYVLSIGPGNYFALIDSRTRLAVALTGGQGKLQAWAVELLAKSRDGMERNGGDGRISKQYWSDQVHRLRPGSVTIAPVFEDRQWAVCLNYGSAFFHWSIVVGPPGSRPDPKSNGPTGDDVWYRWRDGLYDWQQR
jgi:hypothetical protein